MLQGCFVRGSLPRTWLALSKQRVTLSVSKAPRLVRLAPCLPAPPFFRILAKHCSVCQVVLSRYRCNVAGCQKQALYNFEGERPALVCGQHRAEGMASPARVSLCPAHPQVASIIALVYERSAHAIAVCGHTLPMQKCIVQSKLQC